MAKDEFPHIWIGILPMESDPSASPRVKDGLPAVPQAVVQPLTRAAIFLVVTMNPGAAGPRMVRSFCGDLPALLRAVGFRDIEGNLSCVMGFGSDAWDKPPTLNTLNSK